MQISKPTINRLQWTALGIVILLPLVLIVSSGTFGYKKVPISPLDFGHLAVPCSTNANYVFVTFTNRSSFVVHYLTKPLQVNSNGVWSGPPGPTGQRLSKLLARQSGVLMVEAASTNQNTRIPVLWGYDYTPSASKWQQLREDFMGRIHGRGGNGFLYTNYLTALKL